MNCDSLAPWYRWLEYLIFGLALQHRRLEYLDQVTNARNVLILGDGDGRFTAEFLRRNPVAFVDSIDISHGMMGLTERRLRTARLNSERVRLLVADALTVQLTGNYDLVVTHYFLDCFTTKELETLAQRVSAAARPGGTWLLSEFQVPARGWWRFPALLVIRMLYSAFRLLTGLRTNRLPDYATVLESGGFRRARQKRALGGLLVSEIWKKIA